MKRNCLITSITVFLLAYSIVVQAQPAQAKLDQVKLMKQFVGTWQCEIGKDTTRFWEVKSFGTGLECALHDVASGKLIREAKRLWGYDKRTDKYIGLEVTNWTDMRIYAQWFTSNYKGEAVLYDYISDLKLHLSRVK